MFNLRKFENVEYIYIIAPEQPIPVPYTNSGEEMEPVTNSEDTNFWKNTFKIIQTCYCAEWHTSNASQYGSCCL